MLPIGLIAAARSPASARCSRGASRRSRTCASSSSGRSARRCRHRRRARRARRARLGVGLCFALCAFVFGDDRAGVRARRAGPAAAPPAPTSSPRSIGLVGRSQAPLRRLHRPPRHRADVPRLRRRGLQAGRAGAAEAGRAGRRSAASRSGTTRCASPTTARSRWSPAHVSVFAGRQADRRRCSRRSGSSASTRSEPTTEVAIRRGARPKTSTSCSPATTSQQQTATLHVVVNPLVNWIWLGFGVLALGTGHRAAAGARASRSRSRACPAGAGDDGAARAAAAARRRRARCTRSTSEGASEAFRRAADAARARAAEGDHLHVRHVRPQAARRVHVLAGRRRCAARSPGWSSEGKTREQVYRVLHGASTAARSRSRRRSTKASTGWPGRSRTLIGLLGRGARRDRSRSAGRAREQPALAAAAAAAAGIPPSSSASPMSSATSTDAQAAPPRRRAALAADRRVQPWHFFVVARAGRGDRWPCSCRRAPRPSTW